MIKDSQLKTIINCANIYKDKLLDKNVIFIYKNQKNNYYDFIETLFLDVNFLHLTGVVRDRKIVNDASTFFDLAIHNKLNKNILSERADGTTAMKLSVLPNIVNITNNAKMIGNYSNRGTLLFTDKIVGNIHCCLGFIKSNSSKYYLPNTVLRKDMRDITDKPQCRIVAILQKDKNNLEYNKLCVCSSQIPLKDIVNKLNINTIISNNIYSQEIEIKENNYKEKLQMEYATIKKEELKEYIDSFIKKQNPSSFNTADENISLKKEEINEFYNGVIEKEISLYHGIDAENVIYFDSRDITILDNVIVYYKEQPQSKIDKILENINSLPKGLNPDGKLDILRKNGIKHSCEMDSIEKKAAFDKEKAMTSNFSDYEL